MLVSPAGVSSKPDLRATLADVRTQVFVDYYELLEVDPQASTAVIKAAYRASMVRDHADQNPGSDEANERMILLARAKQVLLDERTRQLHDLERQRWQLAARRGVAPPRWRGGQAPADGMPFSGPVGARRVEVDLREVSLSKLLVGVGMAAVLGTLAFAAHTVADRSARRKRRRWL